MDEPLSANDLANGISTDFQTLEGILSEPNNHERVQIRFPVGVRSERRLVLDTRSEN